MFSDSGDLEGKLVYRIILKGLKKAKKKEILSTIKSLEGAPLDLNIIDQDYQALYALGFFEEIYVSTESAIDPETKMEIPGMLNLVFEFIEKPTIRKKIFRGNVNMSFGFLMDDINIKRGDFLDIGQIHSDISAIIDKYHSKGFNYVKVDYETFQNEELKEQNQVDIIFIIDEGLETYVSEIILEGNEKITDFTLKNKLKTKERKFLGLQKGVFIESEFYEGLEEIKKHYRDQGFYLVEIYEPEITRYEIEENEQKKEIIRIKIYIKEGNQYKFGGLEVEGNKIFTKEDLLYGLKLKKGQLFNYTKYQETLYTLQTKYTDAGYIQTIINDEPIIDDENETITIKISIVESKRSYIEAVYFKGNEKTKNYVLERTVVTEVGEIFNSSKLMASLIKLHNLGFFSNVEYDIQQGSAPGLLKITYIMEEQQTAEIRFGLQIPANKWPPEITLFAELAEKNFLGRELQFSGKVDVSLYKQGFDISIDDPWFLNYPWSLGASLKLYHNWHETAYRKINFEDKLAYWESENNFMDLFGYNPTVGEINELSEKIEQAIDSNGESIEEGDPLNEINDLSENEVRVYYHDKADGNNTINRNYIGHGNDFFNVGVHDLNFEASLRTGYRFLKYFSISGGLSVEPLYTWLPSINGDVEDLDEGWEKLISSYNGWTVKNKLHSTFSISTTMRRVNPFEGIRFSLSGAYTFGHYDSISLSSKFTAYWKILDIYFNDWAFKNVIVFNASASFIFPGFQHAASKATDPEGTGSGPTVHPTDRLTVDGMFAGRGWANSIGMSGGFGEGSTRRFIGRSGYVKLDFSLEYRLPIYDQIIWVAGFIDMVNLIEGPDPDNFEDSWEWWKSDDPDYQPLGIDNWYGSIGVGFELTFPQLPLSFFIVKRFKINYNSGIEWLYNQPNSANLDFVLSIVGFYF